MANVSYQHGVITSVELAAVELSHTRAEMAQLRSLHDLIVAQARMKHAAGIALP